ncbi:helix-turn-helix domain-containing protein [Lentzea sp. NBRC 102530]|uniref:helix-turn-helix domain-containing protein n=1 Tax=Lentzea sp. NBRC 102530 TaxID=3032201 RepID=UPI0024A55E77|nr:helix-turn-helix domain-containing protein [Lentzea sp. NBRC 102530]GLY53108.1 XRE family transcriptional regulator [Lentzea sp. NBRC 102530]
MTDQEQPQQRVLADRLGYLFRSIRQSGEREYSNEDVAEAITRDQGVTISASYIWYLRTGQRDNPTLKHLTALATFFGVPPAYFFDDAVREQVEGEIALVTALKDNGVREVAMRASGLSDKSLDTITEVINRVRELEGLPPKES